MSIEKVLRTIALVSAWRRGDEEAVLLLIKEAGPHAIPDLIEFVLLILEQNVGPGTTAYLTYLSQQALAPQAQEAEQ